MNKKFKRLISVILTVMMAIGMMPFSGLTTVSAATLTKGTTIYFDTNGNSTFTKDGAVPSVIFKNSDSNSALSSWVTMTLVSGSSTIYSATVPVDNASYVQFRRSSSTGDSWNSGTKNLAVLSGKNLFKIASWSNTSWYNSTGSWSTYNGGGGSGGTTTGYFNVNADLVDYYNDQRVGHDDSATYRSKNQGTWTAEKNKPYSQFNAWISGLSGYADATVSAPDNGDGTRTIYWDNTGRIGDVWINYWGGGTTQQFKKMTYVSGAIYKVDIPTAAANCAFTDNNNWNNKLADNLTLGLPNLYKYNTGWSFYGNTVKTPIPLYFGDLYHQNQLGGDVNWWYRGANVSFVGDSTKAVVQGIVGDYLVNGQLVTSYDDSVLVPLFEENAYANQSDYMKFYKNLQFPFTATTTNGVTKYSFDSTKNTVYYDYANKRLVRDDSLIIKDDKGQRGYFPFNSDTNDSDNEKLNFATGTKFTIPFTINTDGKDANGNDITFNFTGDDDVWVYIDGALVLDMGGAHELASGNINFRTKTANVTTGTADAQTDYNVYGGNSTYASNGKATVNFSDITVKLADGSTCSLEEHMAKEGEVHTLVMYYMERGMWNSNMSIDFSFVPLPSGLSLSKDVNVSAVNKGLQEDARIQDAFDFNMTDDSTNNGEYAYTIDFNGNGTYDTTTTNHVVTGVSDSAYAKDFKYATGTETGLKLGTTFTIVETVDSDKYSTRWYATDLKTSKPAGSGTTTTAKVKLGEADPDNPFATASYNVNFVNTMKVGTVAVKKAWGVGTAPTDTEFDFKVEVDLSGTGNTYQAYALDYTNGATTGTTGADGTFKIKANETVTFAGIPVGAKVKVTETTTSGDSWTVDGDASAESTVVTDGSSQTLTITNKTNEIEVNRVIYVEAGKATTYNLMIDGEEITNFKRTRISSGLIENYPTFTAIDSNKKYEVSYTGSKTDGTKVKGTITVYSYKATDKVYVFDYGLKSDIAKTNTHGDGLLQDGVFYNTEAQKVEADKTSAYLDTNSFAAKEGTTNDQTSIAFEGNSNLIVYNTTTEAYQLNDGNSVIFTPLKFMDKVEEWTYKANIKADDCDSNNWDSTNPETGTVVNGTIKVMPASVVYYEDNFNADARDDSSSKIVYTGTTAPEGTSLELTQSNGQTEQYGHDDAYNTTGNQKDSGGSSTKLTADGYNTKATFTFTGTGFDILARTTDQTAGIVYTIEKKNESTGEFEMFRMGAVDTYYVNGDLYQLPVIHEEMEYGTYTVTLGIKQTGNLLTTYDEEGNKLSEVDTRKYVVYLDGVRIYNPMGTSGDSAYIANEKDVTVSKIPSLVVGDGTVTEKGIVDEYGNTINSQVINGASAVIASYPGESNTLDPLGTTQTEVATGDASANTDSVLTYLNAGPNNELYLDDSAALAFVAKATNATDKTLQIEAKLVKTQEASGTIDGLDLRVLSNKNGTVEEKTIDTIKSSTAMYYKIPVEDCIALGNDYYLVAILGNIDESGAYSLSFSNLKYKNYTIGTPYDTTTYDASAYLAAASEGDNTFVSINIANGKGLKKNTWQSYNDNSVTLTKNVFGESNPKFAMYYVNAKGDKVKITVYAKKVDGDEKTFQLRYKTPNAKGNFPVELHYVTYENGKEVESSDYISTTLKVVR